MNTKKRQKKEIYEDYWKLTVGNTDFFSKEAVSYKILKFLNDFVDTNTNIIKRGDCRYLELQKNVLKISPKQAKKEEDKLVSTRKEINQFIKIGFFKPGLTKKHPFTENFLNSPTQKKKQRFFSQIFTENSLFNCSVTDNKDVKNHMKFFLSTLEEVQSINIKDDLKGFMVCDIDDYKKGYLTRDELNYYNQKASKLNFKNRKYNQIGFLKNFLNKMTDLKVVDDQIYFMEDAKDIFPKGLIDKDIIRDNYKQRLWVNDLKEESENKCMVDRITSRCVGSHIKSWKDCKISNTLDFEAFNQNNGLFLNKILDDMFDKGIISFNNNGSIIVNKFKQDKLNSDEIDKLKKQRIDSSFLNDQRLEFLRYHRKKHNIEFLN